MRLTVCLPTAPSTELPHHVLKAVRMRARLGANTSTWRRSQFASFEAVARNFPCASGPRWELMGALLRKAGSSDTTLASDATPALQLTGIIRPSGRGGPVPLPPGVTSDTVRTSLATLLETHAEERRRGFFRLPSTRGQEMLGILRTEATKGFWREHDLKEASGSMGDWCGWLFFPVNAADKVRGCLGGHQRVHLSTRVQLGPRH